MHQVHVALFVCHSGRYFSLIRTAVNISFKELLLNNKYTERTKEQIL
jgi:hypothetical protein